MPLEDCVFVHLRAWLLGTALRLSGCFLQVSTKVCAEKGETILRLLLAGPYSVTQGTDCARGFLLTGLKG